MKRLIAAAALLGFVIAAYFTGYAYINNTCETAKKLVEECISVYERDNNAHSATKILNDFWSENEGTLSIFAHHSSIDEIELAISSMLVHSNVPDNEIFYEYSSTVKTLLHQLMEDSTPNMHSIS